MRAALANVAFTREHLNPRAIFDRARDGEIESAERRLLLFNCEPVWLQAALLTVAWLALEETGAEDQDRRQKIVALRDRLAPVLGEDPTFRLLLQRLDAALGPATMPDLPALKDPPDEHDARAIVANLGSQDDEGLGLSEGVERVDVEDNERVLYLAERDAPLLVSFAFACSERDDEQGNKEQGNKLFDEYLAIQGSNSYVEYRTEALGRVLAAMLAYPSQHWLLERLPALISAVLTIPADDFQERLPLTVLAMRAAAGLGDAQVRLNNWWTWAENQASSLRDERGKGDSRGQHRRRFAALAECLAMLPLTYDPNSRRIGRQGDQPEPARLEAIASILLLALDLPRGYAGYQSPACLSLAEAIRVCSLEQGASSSGTTLLQSALLDARSAAHNIQDSTFCARTTARYNAMHLRWWTVGGFDVLHAAEDLRADPDAEQFSAQHVLGETYELRNTLSDKKPLPDAVRAATTLPQLARDVYKRPLAEFERLNEGHPTRIATLDDGRVAELISVPDVKFAPWLAARFAAEALVTDSLDARQKAALIQSLVPRAVAYPTALDSVLSRLLLAAFPLLDKATLKTLANIAPMSSEQPV
jgi:hypothetical protein